MKLYSYFRSSAAFRVRIALNLKGVRYETVPVHLMRDGGEQLTDAYRRTNPAALVPALDDGGLILEERFPDPALLPADAPGRAVVRAIALSIACDIHPLNNLRVMRYLVHELHVGEQAKSAWYRHWIEQGLQQVEQTLLARGCSGSYAFRPGHRSADLQRAALRMRPDAGTDVDGHRRALHAAGRLRTRATVGSARRRVGRRGVGVEAPAQILGEVGHRGRVKEAAVVAEQRLEIGSARAQLLAGLSAFVHAAKPDQT
jgi:maleylpyruvate isomerase